jgi:hypothetical protein
MKMSKEECEESGKVWVDAFQKEDGTYVHGYCKDESTGIRSLVHWSNTREIEKRSSHEERAESGDNNFDDLASKNFKLPRSNLVNARRTYGDIKRDEHHLGSDLRSQDFEDAKIQSERISEASGKETQETDRLSSSQLIKAHERYAQQKKKIAKREYSENKKKIKSETTATKKQIKSESKRIRHAKKQAKREKKLERLKGK